jgi:sulfur carrier protein
MGAQPVSEPGRGQPGELLITVNGQPQSMPIGATARDVVAALGWEGRPLAVELNEQVVPRAELAGRTVCHGDRLEIVTLVGGG